MAQDLPQGGNRLQKDPLHRGSIGFRVFRVFLCFRVSGLGFHKGFLCKKKGVFEMGSWSGRGFSFRGFGLGFRETEFVVRVSGDLGFRLFDWGSKNPDPETYGPTQGPP